MLITNIYTNSRFTMFCGHGDNWENKEDLNSYFEQDPNIINGILERLGFSEQEISYLTELTDLVLMILCKDEADLTREEILNDLNPKERACFEAVNIANKHISQAEIDKLMPIDLIQNPSLLRLLTTEQKAIIMEKDDQIISEGRLSDSNQPLEETLPINLDYGSLKLLSEEEIEIIGTGEIKEAYQEIYRILKELGFTQEEIQQQNPTYKSLKLLLSIIYPHITTDYLKQNPTIIKFLTEEQTTAIIKRDSEAEMQQLFENSRVYQTLDDLRAGLPPKNKMPTNNIKTFDRKQNPPTALV